MLICRGDVAQDRSAVKPRWSQLKHISGINRGTSRRRSQAASEIVGIFKIFSRKYSLLCLTPIDFLSPVISKHRLIDWWIFVNRNEMWKARGWTITGGRSCGTVWSSTCLIDNKIRSASSTSMNPLLVIKTRTNMSTQYFRGILLRSTKCSFTSSIIHLSSWNRSLSCWGNTSRWSSSINGGNVILG